jgi:hypothetical protein
MGPEAILLSVLQGGREGTYRFTCPTCFDAVEKRADRKIVALLVSAGVDVASRDEIESRTASMFDQEDEEPDPRGPLPSGPAFTADDLIDFHYLLTDDRYIEDFLASQP